MHTVKQRAAFRAKTDLRRERGQRQTPQLIELGRRKLGASQVEWQVSVPLGRQSREPPGVLLFR